MALFDEFRELRIHLPFGIFLERNLLPGGLRDSRIQSAFVINVRPFCRSDAPSWRILDDRGLFGLRRFTGELNPFSIIRVFVQRRYVDARLVERFGRLSVQLFLEFELVVSGLQPQFANVQLRRETGHRYQMEHGFELPTELERHVLGSVEFDDGIQRFAQYGRMPLRLRFVIRMERDGVLIDHQWLVFDVRLNLYGMNRLGR